MKTVSIEELTQKFGPPMNVPPYGECLVIQGPEFDPDWEVFLGDQGFNCYFGDLDAHPVTFVQLKRRVAEGKVVYVPPPRKAAVTVQAPVIARSNQVEVKELEIERTEYGEEENALLLKEFDALAAAGKKYGAMKAISEMPEFRKNHSVSGLQQHLKRLLKKREKKGSKATKDTKSADAPKASDAELAIETLQQAYDALSKAYVELKNEFLGIKGGVGDLAGETVKLQAETGELKESLVKHKHAQGSGEAMLPMEVLK